MLQKSACNLQNHIRYESARIKIGIEISIFCIFFKFWNTRAQNKAGVFLSSSTGHSTNDDDQ